MRKINSNYLLEDVTSTGAGESKDLNPGPRVFQAIGSTSSGSGSATIKVQGSLDNVNFVNLATITLTLSTTVATDGFAIDSLWKYIRGNVTAISGTDATVSLIWGD